MMYSVCRWCIVPDDLMRLLTIMIPCILVKYSDLLLYDVIFGSWEAILFCWVMTLLVTLLHSCSLMTFFGHFIYICWNYYIVVLRWHYIVSVLRYILMEIDQFWCSAGDAQVMPFVHSCYSFWSLHLFFILVPVLFDVFVILMTVRYSDTCSVLFIYYCYYSIIRDVMVMVFLCSDIFCLLLNVFYCCYWWPFCWYIATFPMMMLFGTVLFCSL